MERVSIDALASATDDPGVDRRHLSDPLGTTDVAINHYRIAPGEGFPAGLHAHADQEEVFVVLSGEATFETLDGEISVGEGEAVRFAPGEFQSGRNDAERTLAAVAIGAPRESDDVRVPIGCPDCDGGEVRLDFDGERPAFVCPACGAERVACPCPDCGIDDLRVTLDDRSRPIVTCASCGAAYETPPVRGDW